MDEKTLKEYAYDEAAGQNAPPPEDAPQSGEAPDAEAPQSAESPNEATFQDIENQKEDAPSQYSEGQGADAFPPYSGNPNAGAPLNLSKESDSNTGGGARPGASSANQEQSGDPGTSSGYGQQADLGTPPGYSQQGPGTPPPGYGPQAGPGMPPPGYGRNSWQNGPSGSGPGNGPQGYGPGAPPPNYGRNNWQQTPPPGYGYRKPNQGGYNPYNGPKKSNNMALASLLLGIMSIVLCCCGGFGVILGAVGIVLAILSRGSEPMETNAKVGIGLSIGGIVLGILILIMSFAAMGSDQFRNEMNRNGYGNYESYRHYFEHGGL